MKWADYLISAVNYRHVNNKRYIAKCLVHPDNGESVGTGFQLTRVAILQAIDNKNTLITIYKKDGSWNKGAEVIKVKINNYFYLKTDPNNKEEDNLENLPEF